MKAANYSVAVTDRRTQRVIGNVTVKASRNGVELSSASFRVYDAGFDLRSIPSVWDLLTVAALIVAGTAHSKRAESGRADWRLFSTVATKL